MSAISAPRTLRTAVVPRSSVLIEATLVLAGVGLIALAAQVAIPLPFTPVPITGQTFAVLLIGSAYGALRGSATLLAYLAAGVAGLPFYAEGASGWDVVTGPSGGYLVGMLITSAVVGRLAEQRWDRSFASATGAMLLGSVVIYGCGLPWLSYKLGDLGAANGLADTLEAGLYPFVVGDLVKLYLAGALLPGAWRLVERMTGRSRS
jgi:biotin transport system substrate-specific component